MAVRFLERIHGRALSTTLSSRRSALVAAGAPSLRYVVVGPPLLSSALLLSLVLGPRRRFQAVLRTGRTTCSTSTKLLRHCTSPSRRSSDGAPRRASPWCSAVLPQVRGPRPSPPLLGPPDVSQPASVLPVCQLPTCINS
jgi:hypothetical protein